MSEAINPSGDAARSSPVPQPVGFWLRAVARVIDWFVIAAAGICVSILLSLIAGMVRASPLLSWHST